MELTLTLDKMSKEPLQAQIFDQLRDLILSGKLHAGSNVPPSRALAERLTVSRNTVIHAYERLTSEGYLEPRGTDGMFVSSLLPDDALLVSDATPYERLSRKKPQNPCCVLPDLRVDRARIHALRLIFGLAAVPRVRFRSESGAALSCESSSP